MGVANPSDHRRRRVVERDELEEKEEERKKVRPNRYRRQGTSLGGALLWSKGASEGVALLSTAARVVATYTPQCATLDGALMCTKGVRHLDALQSGLDMEYVSPGSICENCFLKGPK
jgi:hypothetical protein